MSNIYGDDEKGLNDYKPEKNPKFGDEDYQKDGDFQDFDDGPVKPKGYEIDEKTKKRTMRQPSN